MEKRGQISIETIASYWWAILAVLIMMGIVTYLIFFRSHLFLAGRCYISDDLHCIDFKIDTDHIKVILENGMGETIRVNNLTVDECNCATTGASLLKAGGRGEFIINGCNFLDKGKGQIELTYTPATGIANRKLFGDIVGRTEDDLVLRQGYPTDNLVVFLQFDKSKFEVQNFIDDVSKNGNDATCSSGTCPKFNVCGRIGTSAFYDEEDNYLVIPSPDDVLNGLNETFTLSFWIKRDCVDCSHRQLYKSAPVNVTREYWEIYVTSGNEIGYNSIDGTGNGWAVIGDTEIDDTDTWHHVAVVRTGSSGTNLLIYLDGQLDESAERPTIYTSLGQKVIGATEDWNAPQGLMDEFVIWKRALTAEEIQTIYDAN